jgi:hypothetical protein
MGTLTPRTALTRVGSTGLAGFTLVNGTPTIITWTPPNDGNPHVVLIFGEVRVITALTGGNVGINFGYPDGSAVPQATVYGGGGAAGFHALSNVTFAVQPGQVVTIVQSAAATAGSAVVWLEVWAS